MISFHYLIHAGTLTIIAVLSHEFIFRPICQDKQSGSNGRNTAGVTEDTSHILIREEESKGDIIRQKGSEEEIIHTDSIVSSVWCNGQNRNSRICLFHNICYHPGAREFLFFRSGESNQENITPEELNTAVLDLSSVSGHSSCFLSLIHLPSESAKRFSLRWVTKLSLGFSRFKPDNLMHLFHDDILPLHHTLALISEPDTRTGKYKTQVVFLDDLEPGNYIHLYTVLLSYIPFFRKDLNSLTQMTCFKSIYLGLSKSTVWYQYGFFQPQGPIQENHVTAQQIRRTTQYFLTNIPRSSSPQIESLGGKYVILFCRTENRLILNEAELILSLSQRLKVKVIRVSDEDYTFGDLIHLVQGASGIIAMHGAILSQAIFLEPGSFLVELFPFAVNPDNYTPYKTMANLPGMAIVYRSWRNLYAGNNVYHAERLPELGGIRHLTPEEQSNIVGEQEVQRHLCCDDPSWLFRIYQDTVVNTDEVAELVNSALKESERISSDENQTVYQAIPSKVSNIQCDTVLSLKGQVTLAITWSEPWNIQHLTFSKLHYEILVQDEGSDDHIKYLISQPRLTLSTVNGERSVSLWIRSVVDDIAYGPYASFVGCHTV